VGGWPLVRLTLVPTVTVRDDSMQPSVVDTKAVIESPLLTMVCDETTRAWTGNAQRTAVTAAAAPTAYPKFPCALELNMSFAPGRV
jgi:hypothetical protein